MTLMLVAHQADARSATAPSIWWILARIYHGWRRLFRSAIDDLGLRGRGPTARGQSLDELAQIVRVARLLELVQQAHARRTSRPSLSRLKVPAKDPQRRP